MMRHILALLFCLQSILGQAVGGCDEICGCGYEFTDYDVNGIGKEFSFPGEGIENCRAACDERDGCTAFEYNYMGNEDYKCGTYTGGARNIAGIGSDATGVREGWHANWQTCIRTVIECPAGSFQVGPQDAYMAFDSSFSGNRYEYNTIEKCQRACAADTQCYAFLWRAMHRGDWAGHSACYFYEEIADYSVAVMENNDHRVLCEVPLQCPAGSTQMGPLDAYMPFDDSLHGNQYEYNTIAKCQGACASDSECVAFVWRQFHDGDWKGHAQCYLYDEIADYRVAAGNDCADYRCDEDHRIMCSNGGFAAAKSNELSDEAVIFDEMSDAQFDTILRRFKDPPQKAYQMYYYANQVQTRFNKKAFVNAFKRWKNSRGSVMPDGEDAEVEPLVFVFPSMQYLYLLIAAVLILITCCTLTVYRCTSNKNSKKYQVVSVDSEVDAPN